MQLAAINLDEVIEFDEVPVQTEEKAAWIDDFLSTQHSTGFHDREKPLWRVVVLNPRNEDADEKVKSLLGADIAFIWHHVIGDGKSGLGVHTTILQALTTPLCDYSSHSLAQQSAPSQSNGKKCSLDIVIKPPGNDLFPSLEQIFAMPASQPTFLRRLSDAYFKSYLPFQRQSQTDLDTSKWSGAPYQDRSPIKTLIKHIIIPASSQQKLVKLCRAKGTTITPFLQTIIAQTISKHYNHMWRLRCATAISMRRFMAPELDIGEQEMGLWVSAFHFELDPVELSGIDKGSKKFWGMARKNSKRIAGEIEKRDTDLGIGGLRQIPDFRKNLESKMGKKREDSFAVTNIGTFDGDSASELAIGNTRDIVKIEKVIFSQSCHVNGSALQFCIMSVKDKSMVIAVSWQEGVVSIKDTECIASSLQIGILKVLEEPVGEGFA